MNSIRRLFALLSWAASTAWAAPGPSPALNPEASTSAGSPAGALAGPGHRAPETRVRRFAVVIGANHGGTDRVRLRYALDDAESFAAVMQIYGGVAPERLFRVDEPGPDQVAAAFAAVHAALAAEAHGAGASGAGAPDRTELLVYYSGHADADGLLLGGQRLPYATLRQHINAVPASVRIGIVDACASGAFVRAKGGQRRPPFLVDQAVQVTGHAYLASASADEAAQESDRLKASYFSHALVTGLRGAADVSGDGVVTLNEAYQFAFRETLARTEGSHLGAQHPSYDMQLVGSGDVVLTDLRATSAALLVGSDVGGRLYVRDADGRLLAELDKPRGQAIRLGLAPGDYRVRLEDLDGVGHAARLRLEEGGATHLAAADLSPVPAEPGRARGADVLVPAAGMALGSPAGAEPGATAESAGGPAVAAPGAAPGQPPGGLATQGAAGAGEAWYAREIKFGLGIVPGLATDDEDSDRTVSFNLLVGRTGAVSLVEVGGLFNSVTRTVTGAQVGGLGNRVGGSVDGAQVGGLVNLVGGDLSGVGVAGVANSIAGNHDGVAVGGVAAIIGGAATGVNVGGLVAVVQGGGYGVQVAGLVGSVAEEHTGLQAAGLVDHIGGDLLGVQVAGLVAHTAGGSVGGQFAGLHVQAQRVHGLQMAGVSTWAEGSVDGAQLALVNVGGDVRGAQIGLVNVANRVRGTQIGLVNVADSVDGASIGLLPWVADGRHHVEAFSTELALANLGYRLGNEYLHGVLSVGGAAASGEGQLVVGAGIGGHLPLNARLSLDFDLVSNLLLPEYDFSGSPQQVNTLRVLARWRFAEHFAVFAGPSYNLGVNDQRLDLGFEPARVHEVKGLWLEHWPGLVVGVAL